ncbi:hypothetical protein FBEOM_7644 [Fusarium beomiforme]|uniref:C2H2-type domain-containing protein n=1 Tax=Fusarium beomiforme TaxID=44412 RepID=A0A9P5DV85_9HYPO|nr:hypothetical protein FBEOM_7644 [Fusarium beomiforme]
MESGVTYFEVTNEGEWDQDTSITNERAMAHERIALVLQAFPSIKTEIIGEEMIDRLMEIAKNSVLPLLSSLTDEDVEDWLMPRGLEDKLVQLFTDFAEIFDLFLFNRSDDLGLGFLLPREQSDARSNAMVGCALGLLKSDEAMTAKDEALIGPLTAALSIWLPLSVSSPSTMEYLIVISFCGQFKLDSIGRPPSGTVDTKTLQGLLLSRLRNYEAAVRILEATVVDVTAQYGPTSIQLGIVTAELANCFNILRQEGLAEDRVRRTLALRLDPSLLSRRDSVYLRFALADSFIGRARYHEVVPILQSILENHNMSAKFRMMSALRLARSRRRMHGDAQQAFKQNSPLWTGLKLLSHVPKTLVTEYIEELACNISGIPHTQLRHSDEPEELIQAVNSLLGSSGSLDTSTSWDLYSRIQRDYLRQVEKRRKTAKGKEKADPILDGEDGDMGARASPQATPRLPLRGYSHNSEEEGPWSEKLILSFDGGGACALSSLLILKNIMSRIRDLEVNHPDGPAYSSSSYPWMSETMEIPSKPRHSSDVDGFLPCHYFDYMAGTSTGGVFHEKSTLFFPRAKYSSTVAKDAFRMVTLFGPPSTLRGLGLGNMPHEETFRKIQDRTKTMVTSLRVQDNTRSPVIWRSYEPPIFDFEEKANGRYKATISDVALATTATPPYFDPIQIQGVKFLGGGTEMNNIFLQALNEIEHLHWKAPAVIVCFGRAKGRLIPSTSISGQKGWVHDVIPGLPRKEGKWHTRTDNRKGIDVSYYRVRAKQRYILDAEGDLSKFPFDDWRPPTTGETTFQEVNDITNAYLEVSSVRGMIDSIAQEAVRIRRSRARTERWETFAVDVVYICPICSDLYQSRADLRGHLKQYHADIQMSDQECEATLDEARRY